MRFLVLCESLDAISQTSKRLEKTALLSQLIEKTPEKDLSYVMLLIKGRVFPEWDKTTIGISQKLVIKALTHTGASEKEIVAQFKKLGDLGLVAEHVASSKRQATLASFDLTLADVIAGIRKLATTEGTGSVQQKMGIISQLLSSASPLEAKFLIRILLEDLRVGIADGTVRDAIVWAAVRHHHKLRYDADKNVWEGEGAQDLLKEWSLAVQQALDRSNDAARIATTALHKSIKELQKIPLPLGTPTKVMLAQRSLDIEDAFKRVGEPAAIEYKYDGFRMQIHVMKGEIKLFTRRLEEVTAQFPDVIAAIKATIKQPCILDAEVVGYDPKTKRHLPFQQISQRIRRKYEIDKLAQELPVEVHVFDVLLYKEEAVYEEPFEKRRALLEKIVPIHPPKIRPSEMIVTADRTRVEEFYAKALALGYEGLMFKAREAPYQPGSRVGTMVKLKPTLDTLDVAIVGAEWGEGKRSGWLTSFVIACQDEDGNLVELGRVGTGFKELEQEEGVTFAQMTDLLKEDILEERGKEVSVKPKVVIEVKCEEIQRSPSYSSGFALRFPRIVRIRSDRRKDEVSTLADVLDLFEAQKGKK